MKTIRWIFRRLTTPIGDYNWAPLEIWIKKQFLPEHINLFHFLLFLINLKNFKLKNIFFTFVLFLAVIFFYKQKKNYNNKNKMHYTLR